MFTIQAQETEEKQVTEYFLSNVENILLNGTQLILNQVFKLTGFDAIDDDILKHLVIAFITINLNVQRGENIIRKDTIPININNLTLVENKCKETGKTQTYFKYDNKNYNSDFTSIKLFRGDRKNCNAYIIN